MMRYLLAGTENKNQCSILNKFMYENCATKVQQKKEKSNSNINIFNILHLPFDMLCYLIESMMVRCKMNQQ